MISKKMVDALNEQVNMELASSYLYLSMAQNFHADGWEGMAKWMEAQATEEWAHGMRLVKHINDRGGRVDFKAIAKPKGKWATPLAAFKDAAKHEKLVTGKIHALVGLAANEKDPAATGMLQWFVNEQVEEEATADQIVATLEKIGNSTNGVFMLDHRLGQRE